MPTRTAALSLTIAASAMMLMPASALAQANNLLTGRNIGAVGGAVAGGIAGKQIAGKKNRTLGIAAGAVGGGVLGAVAGNAYDKSQNRKAKAPLTTGSIGGSKLLTGQNVGIAAGAVGGGLLGNKVAGKGKKTIGTIGGAVGGGVVGGVLGRAIDRR